MNKKIKTNFYCKSKYWSRRMNKIRSTVNKILFINEIGFKKKNLYFLNLIFVEDKKIKQLNKMYRKINKATDVLTFISKSKNNKMNDEVYCDIFFSAETIKNDSKRNLINFYDHLTHLIIHCFLHVNGYKHKKESDFMKMKKLEEKILMYFNIESPYLI